MESIRNLVQESGSQQKNQVTTSLSAQERQVKQLQDKIAELEKKAQAQAKQINLLQDALKTFIDSFQTDPAPASTDTIAFKTYTVKNGDSLGKIAKAHKTSTQTLRGMNNLSGDKIIVGQKIKVPEMKVPEL